jgi:hypothetical protein
MRQGEEFKCAFGHPFVAHVRNEISGEVQDSLRGVLNCQLRKRAKYGR